MKKKFEHIYAYGWCCLLLLLAVGCQREELTPAEGGEEIFTLRCVPEDMGGEIRTRTTDIENTVEDYAVLIFRDRDAGLPQQNILVKKVLASDVTGLVSFSMAQNTAKHYLYVVANSQGKLESLKESISTEQDFLNIRVSRLKADGSLPVAPFGMCSSRIVLPNLSFEAFKVANSGSADVLLKKNVAKFRVRFSVPAETFIPVSVEYKQMCNYGYLAAAGVGPSSDPTDYLPDMTLQNGDWTSPVYVYEQKCSVRDDAWTLPGFYVILSGHYKESSGLSYYRFALPTPEGTFSDIKRNVSYELNVTDIRNPGHVTYDAALSAPFLNDVSVDLTPNMEGLQDMREIYTNGFYELGLEASVAWIYKPFIGRDYVLPICTVITKTLDSSVTDQLELVHGAEENNFELKTTDVPGTYVLSYHIRDDKVDTDYHTATLVFGTLRKDVKVRREDGVSLGGERAIKFSCSNGKVLGPTPPKDWTWAKSDWCGLGPNATYDESRYYGEIMNSTDENIFIHVRPVKLQQPEDLHTGRLVELVGRNNMIRVFIWRK